MAGFFAHCGLTKSGEPDRDRLLACLPDRAILTISHSLSDETSQDDHIASGSGMVPAIQARTNPRSVHEASMTCRSLPLASHNTPSQPLGQLAHAALRTDEQAWRKLRDLGLRLCDGRLHEIRACPDCHGDISREVMQ